MTRGATNEVRVAPAQPGGPTAEAPSPRAERVREWIADGESDEWIAQRLDVSVRWVREFRVLFVERRGLRYPQHLIQIKPDAVARLRRHHAEIRQWVLDGRGDLWIAHQLLEHSINVWEYRELFITPPPERLGYALMPEDVIDTPTMLDLSGDPLTDAKKIEAVEISLAEVSDGLIRALAARPELHHTLHWRKFEQLVAELLAREGFDVTLTPRSRDRGVDIYALRHEGFGRFLYVVECKRQAPTRKVGPGVVRHLYGVVERERATHGLVATTSTFTREAVAEQRDVRFRVSLRDFAAIRDWLSTARPQR